MQTSDTQRSHRAHRASNVFDFFSGERIEVAAPRIIRISPEFDGFEILYSNELSGRIYNLQIICWALFDTGEVSAMIPWLNNIIPCSVLDNPVHGKWEGYHDPLSEEITMQPPRHKLLELRAAIEYFGKPEPALQSTSVIQEIPDCIGTHAVLAESPHQSFILAEVHSWRLTADGFLHGMLIDHSLTQATPVLTGDDCLYSAQKHPHFRYFFQHRIANKIKARDPEALAAVSILMNRSS